MISTESKCIGRHEDCIHNHEVEWESFAVKPLFDLDGTVQESP